MLNKVFFIGKETISSKNTSCYSVYLVVVVKLYYIWFMIFSISFSAYLVQNIGENKNEWKHVICQDSKELAINSKGQGRYILDH